MLPAVRMVCEIDKELVNNYPLETLPWMPNTQGICGMIEEPPLIEIFFNLIEPYFKGARLGLNMVSKVIKGQTIQLHQDRHDGECKNRIHIPLKTNPHSYFYTSEIFHHMQAGFAYVINPREEHGVVNLGQSERIHLIFNVVR